MRRNLGPLEQRSCDGPLKRGAIVPYHRHNQDHVTYCGAGSLAMRRLADDGTTVVAEKIIRAGTVWNSHVTTRAGVLHELEALEDGTIYHCLFAHMGWDGKVVEEHDGNEAAYV